MLEAFKQAMRDLVAEYGMHPSQINYGFCADFACAISEKFEQAEVYSDKDCDPDREYTHSFLELGGMYYDAECIEGVKNWWDLPIFKRQEEEMKDVPVQAR